jgi:hypothetical protein
LGYSYIRLVYNNYPRFLYYEVGSYYVLIVLISYLLKAKIRVGDKYYSEEDDSAYITSRYNYKLIYGLPPYDVYSLNYTPNKGYYRSVNTFRINSFVKGENCKPVIFVVLFRKDIYFRSGINNSSDKFCYFIRADSDVDDW